MGMRRKKFTSFQEKWIERIFFSTSLTLIALAIGGIIVMIVKGNPIPSTQIVYERAGYIFAYDYKTKQPTRIIKILDM